MCIHHAKMPKSDKQGTGSTDRPAPLQRNVAMSPKRIAKANSELYKFHRPKLHVQDTPHPLKWESKLCVHLIHLSKPSRAQTLPFFPQMPPQPLETSYKASCPALPARTQRCGTSGTFCRTSRRSLCST